MKTLLIQYQGDQLSKLESEYARLVAEGVETEVIALGADVEFLLTEKQIPFISGRSLRRHSPPDHLRASEKLGRKILHDTRLSFFVHGKVSLGMLYTMAFQDYLVRLLYYISIAASVAETYPDRIIRLLPSTDIALPTSGVLGVFEAKVTIDAFTVVYRDSKESLQIAEDEIIQIVPEQTHISAKRLFFEFALTALNRSMLLIPKKPVRILGSEYWKNISSLMQELPDTELILLDRAQSTQIRFKDLIKHRMRFVRIDSYASNQDKKLAKQQALFFKKEWDKVSSEILKEVTYEGYFLEEALSRVIDRIITIGGERASVTIDGTYSMLGKVRPQVVVVRASISAQPHFAILCTVANTLGIPSLEIQHGIFYLGEGSYVRDRTAAYIAEYGEQSRIELQQVGFKRQQLFDIGTPRFDRYAVAPEYIAKKDRSTTIGCIAPEVLTGSWNDSYDVLDYFLNLRKAALSIPDVSICIKLRPGNANLEFFQHAIARAFEGLSHSILRLEPLEVLFEKSDFIVSCYSTALLEVLLCGVPMIYDAILPMQNELGESLASYADAGALVYVKTQEGLETAVQLFSSDIEAREKSSHNAKKFMQEKYLFDGHASERLAKVIRELAKQEGTHDTN